MTALAVYNLKSIKFPFRIGFLIGQRASQQRKPYGRVVIEICMKHFEKELIDWKPYDEKRARDQLSNE